MNQKTPDQRRAADAAMQVERAVKTLGEGGRTRYSAYAHSLPIWLRANGLLQTVAFLESKARSKEANKPTEPEKAIGLLVDALRVHLTTAGFAPAAGALSSSIAGLQSPLYRLWQEEAVDSSAWLKRFSAALIGKPDPAASDLDDED